MCEEADSYDSTCKWNRGKTQKEVCESTTMLVQAWERPFQGEGGVHDGARATSWDRVRRSVIEMEEMGEIQRRNRKLQWS